MVTDKPIAGRGGAKAGLFAWVLCLSGLLGGCMVPGPGGPSDTFNLDFSLPAGAKVRGAVVFLVDGVNGRIFQEMLQAGQLPAIKKYFVDRGLYVPRAVANTPSVTLANLNSFATGRLPGHHGVIANNWFDRNRLVWRDYETIAQKNMPDGDRKGATIYEMFAGETTFSIFFQPHRGATKFIENWTSAGPPFFFQWYEFVDRLALSRFSIVIDVARKRRRWPAGTIVYLLAPDFRAYGAGVKSQQYRQALKHTDRQIGRVLGDIKRAGLLDKLIVALVSDHGLGEVTRHLPARQFLAEQVGIEPAGVTMWENTPFERRLSYYRRQTAVVNTAGQRYWAISLRKPTEKDGKIVGFEPWPTRPTPQDLADYPAGTKTVNLPEVLAAHEAVDVVAYAVGPNWVRLRLKTGEVEFHQDGGAGMPISYHPIKGKDPLGWAGKVPPAALTGKCMDERQWLTATAETQYPDLPAQILAYFRSRRAGDIAVFAKPTWDFGGDNRAGHGGLRPADVHVPVLLAGPGVPKTTRKVARVIDVIPTLLKLLGRPIPDGLDGKPLLAEGN